jgi:hypothetical protein
VKSIEFPRVRCTRERLPSNGFIERAATPSSRPTS